MKRELVEPVLAKLMPLLSVLGEPTVMGSYARGESDLGDLDVLLVVDAHVVLDGVLMCLNASRVKECQTRTTFVLDGLRVDVFPVLRERAGSARLYLEGPLARNQQLRAEARKRGMKWRFDGLYDGQGRLLSSRDRDAVLAKILEPTP